MTNYERIYGSEPISKSARYSIGGTWPEVSKAFYDFLDDNKDELNLLMGDAVASWWGRFV